MQTLVGLLSISLVALIGSSDTALQQLIVDVLRTYNFPLQQMHTSLLIENFAETNETHQSQQDLINDVLRQLDGEVLLQFDVLRGTPSGDNLIIVDGNASFERFVSGWRRTRYSLDGYYWIILCERYEPSDKYNLSQRILEDLWKLNIVYAFVSIAHELDEEVQVFTSWPYTETHCAGVKSFETDLRAGLALMDRLTNFHGCPLRVGSFDNQPFIQLDWDNLGKTYLLGFEGVLINAIAEKLNFSVEVVTPPDNDQWGYTKTDGTSTGLMKLIVDESVNLAISSLGYTEERALVMEAGVTHYNSYLVFAVPSGRPYTAFEKLFLPFSWDTWYAVFGTLTLAVIVIMMINTRSSFVKEFVYGQGTWYPITNMINLLLGGPLDMSPQRTFARTLVMLWLIFTLVVRTAYQGSLYKYLQVPKNFSSPLTMDAIDKSGLPYYMLDLAVEFFKDYPNIIARTKYLSHEFPLSQSLNQLGRDELDGVLLVLMDHIAYHNKFFPKDEYVQPAREAVLAFPMAIYYPKRTFLKTTLDREIQLIDSSGLVQYWANQYADYDFSQERRAAAATNALTVDNLVGAFQIWVVLLVMAVLMFTVELATTCCGKCKRVVDWMEEDHSRLRSNGVLFIKSFKQ